MARIISLTGGGELRMCSRTMSRFFYPLYALLVMAAPLVLVKALLAVLF